MQWEQILEFLEAVSSDFVPPLDQEVDLEEYAKKLSANSKVFYQGDDHKAMACVYCNRPPDAFLSMIAVKAEHRGKRYFYQIMQDMMQYLVGEGFTKLKLEVNVANTTAYNVYKKLGFVYDSNGRSDNSEILVLDL